MIKSMAELDYQEISALSEDLELSSEDVRGQPFNSDQYAELAEFADSVFHECSLDEQVEITRCLPAHVSSRRLTLMQDKSRNDILSQLPPGLAEEIAAMLSVAVS